MPKKITIVALVGLVLVSLGCATSPEQKQRMSRYPANSHARFILWTQSVPGR